MFKIYLQIGFVLFSTFIYNSIYSQAVICYNILGGSFTKDCNIVAESIDLLTHDTTFVKQEIYFCDVIRENEDSLFCSCWGSDFLMDLFICDSLYLAGDVFGYAKISSLEISPLYPTIYMTNQQITACNIPPPFCNEIKKIISGSV